MLRRGYVASYVQYNAGESVQVRKYVDNEELIFDESEDDE